MSNYMGKRVAVTGKPGLQGAVNYINDICKLLKYLSMKNLWKIE
jgi:hypothetical protein